MLQKSIFAILSFFILTGMASCKKADVYECVHIWPPGKEIQETYFYCENQKLGDSKSVWISDMKKCIRDPKSPCKWVATDVLERERGRKFYEEQCK